MASLIFARKFSSKLLNKPSLYGSSSSPLSYLTHSRHHFLVSNSLSSILHRNCTSTIQNPSKSPEDSLDQLLLNDTTTYFLAGARHENPSNLNRRVSCKKYPSNHEKYLSQLPKELYNITPEEFHRGIGILLSSMGTLGTYYSFNALLWFMFMGLSMCSVGEVEILFGLMFGSHYVARLAEIKSIEKVVQLRNLQKQGNIPIMSAVLQLINEVKEAIGSSP